MASDTAAETHSVDGGRTLYAAGFNAHHQLSTEATKDLRSFKAIQRTERQDCRILFAEWSTTIMVDGVRVFSLGHQHIDQELGPLASEVRSAIGDHDGLKACLDTEGRLYVVEGEAGDKQIIICKSTDSNPRIGHLARASNGRIAMTAKQAPNGHLCHLTEFDTFETFLRWYEDPSGDGNYPIGHHMFPGRPKSLRSNATSFVLLTESGQVWTWGDSRYQSLGRSISGDGTTPAAEPGVVEALGGINIKYIATGGWQAAALSEDRALYVWGTGSPSGENCSKFLVPGEVTLVAIPGTDGEPLDILSVGIGSDHMAVVTDGGALYVAGQNSNGQLGTGDDQKFLEDWRAVENMGKVHDVTCGPKCTLVWKS